MLVSALPCLFEPLRATFRLRRYKMVCWTVKQVTDVLQIKNNLPKRGTWDIEQTVPPVLKSFSVESYNDVLVVLINCFLKL